MDWTDVLCQQQINIELQKQNSELKNALLRLKEDKDDLDRSNFRDYIEGIQDDSTSANPTILQLLLRSAQQNIDRKSEGYRYHNVIKAFAGYMKLIGGPLAYDTLYANLPLCWPSPSTTNRFITDHKPKVIEGQLRVAELLTYLRERNLPLRVSLSEDATRIVATVTHDPDTNQLVGFPLPLDESGMPTSFSFLARNVKEIQEHFRSNETSSNAYVQMAQPLSRSIPPFCLLTFLTANTFTAESVLSRLNHTTETLRSSGIKVDNFASDGDSRLTKVMRLKSEIGIQDLTFLNSEWFSCGNRTDVTFTQDIIHIGAKARNRLLKTSRVTPIGQKIIAAAHLFYLLRTVSKDKHLLTVSDINPKDRQNFQSVEKICSAKVISHLKSSVPGSEGTTMFLQSLNYCLNSFLDRSMNSADRVYKHWYGLFFFRAWRSWIVRSKEYTLKECFISSNCYLCIELNAHSLVKQIIKLSDDSDGEYGEYMFLPDQQGSQACEGLFRQSRSFSTMYSNIVNFNMLEFLNRINKIQLQAEIINDYSSHITFPRFAKKRMLDHDHSQSTDKLTKSQIVELIERAKLDLSNDILSLGVNPAECDFHCQISPSIFEKDFRYDEITDDEDTENENIDSEFSDEENVHDFDNTNESDGSGVADDQHDRNILLGITGDLELKNYNPNGADLDVDESSRFVIIAGNDGNPKKVLKSAVVWYLNTSKNHLSSDRLSRVRARDSCKAWECEFIKYLFLVSNKLLVSFSW